MKFDDNIDKHNITVTCQANNAWSIPNAAAWDAAQYKCRPSKEEL